MTMMMRGGSGAMGLLGRATASCKVVGRPGASGGVDWTRCTGATVAAVNGSGIYGGLQHQQKMALRTTPRAGKLAGLWQNWINNVWNRLDDNRLKVVGPERLVAEWTLRMGGRALIQGPQDEGFWVFDYNALPWLSDTNQGIRPRATVKLLKVDCNNIEDIKDTGLAHFGLDGLKSLTFVGLRNCDEVTDQGIGHLRKLPALKRVDLAGTGVTGGGVAKLLEGRGEDFSIAVHAMPDLPDDSRVQSEVETDQED